jgi:general secretion pathway protein E
MSKDHTEGVVALVDDIIRRAIAARASDVHFDPGETVVRVRFRVDGLLQDVEELPSAIGPNVVARLKVLAGLLTYRSDIPQEGGIDHATTGFPGDMRVATFPTIRGERVVLRLMAQAHRFLRLEDLGHDPALIERITRQLALPQGLLLVCGPAGSGKTTTLAAMLEYVLRQRPGVSIISVEDPVEIRLDGVTQVEIEPARGFSYPVALRSLLRQDPQVLMIGEVRDAEVADIIIEVALTGHLILSTMHSGSAPEAIIRLQEMGVPAYQITSTLQGVLTQRLLRTVAEPAEPQAADGRSSETLPKEVRYVGRTALGQFVEMTPGLRQAILAGADVAQLSAPKLCPGSLRDDAQRLLQAGRTTREEVRRVLG